MIRQGQTAVFYIATDLETIDKATVTIEAGTEIKLKPTIEGGMLEVQLTQSDTNEMKPGRASIQVKAMVGDEVAVSNVMTFQVLESLDEGVIE